MHNLEGQMMPKQSENSLTQKNFLNSIISEYENRLSNLNQEQAGSNFEASNGIKEIPLISSHRSSHENQKTQTQQTLQNLSVEHIINLSIVPKKA